MVEHTLSSESVKPTELYNNDRGYKLDIEWYRPAKDSARAAYMEYYCLRL
jgi:hypothetical protein